MSRSRIAATLVTSSATMPAIRALEALGELVVRVEAEQVVGGRAVIPVIGERARLTQEARQHLREVSGEAGAQSDSAVGGHARAA
jgi:hypothetical protein